MVIPVCVETLPKQPDAEDAEVPQRTQKIPKAQNTV